MSSGTTFTCIDCPLAPSVEGVWERLHQDMSSPFSTNAHFLVSRKPSIILFVTDQSQSVIQNIDTSLIGLSLAFTEAARAKLIRAFETDEMNTDQILYSPPTESATTPHHSMTKTPTSSALFRIKPISDISELEGVKYCGQVFKSFLLFSSGSFLYVVDQVDLLTSV